MKTLVDIKLPNDQNLGLKKLKQSIMEVIPNCEIILYGLEEKNEYIDTVGFDILVLIDDDVSSESKNNLRNTKIMLELKFDIIFSIMLVKHSVWKKELVRSLPGQWNIDEEGVLL